MPTTEKRLHFIFLTVLADCGAVIASVFFAYYVRFVTGWISSENIPSFLPYVQALMVILPVYLYFFREYGLYSTYRHIRRIEEIFLVSKAVTFSVVILMAVTFFYRGFSYSRIYLVTLWVISGIILTFSRYLMIQWEYRRKIKKRDIKRILLLGSNRNTRQIIQWAKNNPHYGREIVGVLAKDPGLVGKHVEGVPILGISDQCESFIDHLKPNEVILLDTSFTRERITDLVAACEDKFIEFKIGADFYGLLSRNVDVDYISTVPLLGFRPLPLDDIWNRFAKRCFDLLAVSILLLLSFPLWLFVIVLIKLDDGGPIFYSQERMGRDEKVFNLLKFRTMRVDAEKDSGPVWANVKDARRTRIGNFLRRWNLDELPQFLNVLKGEMSLIGPRPERPHFISQFREAIPRYMSRHKVKAGITGWAQVNGYRGNTSIQERIKYDLFYMENWSLLFDIEILLMTLTSRGFKNAY